MSVKRCLMCGRVYGLVATQGESHGVCQTAACLRNFKAWMMGDTDAAVPVMHRPTAQPVAHER